MALNTEQIKLLVETNSLTADDANGPGLVIPADKAIAIAELTAKQEVAKVQAAARNSQLLAITTQLAAGMGSHGTVETGQIIDVALARARALILAVAQEREPTDGE